MATDPYLAGAPQPPVPPDDHACCNSGCVFCVYDMYQEELDRYRLALKAWQDHYATPSGGRASADV